MDNRKQVEIFPEYMNKRAKEYPSVEEQLDMLWHELNINGAISNSVEGGGWFLFIKNIKDAYPKPEELNNTIEEAE